MGDLVSDLLVELFEGCGLGEGRFDALLDCVGEGGLSLLRPPQPCEDCGCVGLVLASTAFGLFCPPALVGELVVRSAQLVGDVGVAGSGQVHQRLSLRHVGRVGLGE